MSGHSKWSQIKRQKGVNDTKRGLTFTKASNAITIAVREGGGVGDPEQNFHLRLAVEAARAANMPKDNIARAIDRAVSKQGGGFEEVIYEGFGPGNVAVMVQAGTDNKNRTISEVKNVFEKNGGTLGQPGSVSYNFKRIGRIIVHKKGVSFDDLFLQIADMGAEDVIENDDDSVAIFAPVSSLMTLKDALIQSGQTITEMKIVYQPISPMTLDDEALERIALFVEKLEDLDDVQQVFVNIAD